MKLTVLQGLPASGKSTLAKQMVSDSGGNTVRVNKDLLSKMLVFGEFKPRTRQYVIKAEVELAKYLLRQELNVIVDDTNLTENYIDRWKNVAVEINSKFEVIRLDTPVHICIERDRIREDSVGRNTITAMALVFGYKPSLGFILCDLDGTLCDIRHRRHFVDGTDGEKKDWKGFFDGIAEDTPRQIVLDYLYKFREEGYQIIFVSARPDNYRSQTQEWLDINFKGDYFTLLMRRSSDKREDSEVKRDILHKYFPDTSVIHKVIDDRPRVLRAWKEEGLDVIDVGDGIEF